MLHLQKFCNSGPNLFGRHIICVTFLHDCNMSPYAFEIHLDFCGIIGWQIFIKTDIGDMHIFLILDSERFLSAKFIPSFIAMHYNQYSLQFFENFLDFFVLVVQGNLKKKIRCNQYGTKSGRQLPSI